MRVTGIWSHFACADEPDHPANDAQEQAFREALEVAERGRAAARGAPPGQLGGRAPAPAPRFDLVRCGIASYGLDPAPGRHARPRAGAGDDRPRPRSRWSSGSPAGPGVSYGHTWTTDRRHDRRPGAGRVRRRRAPPAGNRAEVWVAGRRRPVRGRVCMDQFVVDLGDDLPRPGDEVVLFGPGADGEPTAQDWARGLRHHLLRDRHPDRRPDAPAATSTTGTTVVSVRRRHRRRRRRRRRLSPPPVRPSASPAAAGSSPAAAPGDRPPFGVAALRAAHGDRRRRRAPARRGRRGRRAVRAAGTGRPGRRRRADRRLRATATR